MKKVAYIKNETNHIYYRPVASGGPGGPVPPNFLADQLTLSQPGEHIMPTTLLRALPNFRTLRRPCIYTLSTAGFHS
jgi:hypothetical protein